MKKVLLFHNFFFPISYYNNNFDSDSLILSFIIIKFRDITTTHIIVHFIIVLVMI
jgi:hypothetical protein